jgi:DNA-binding MarR family transcriptional regulator
LTLASIRDNADTVKVLDTLPQPNLGQLLLQGFRWFDDGLIAGLRSLGWPELTRAHSMIFANLDVEGVRIAELARRVGVSRQAVHQSVHELVGMGLLDLRADVRNRSAKLVVPTAAGRRSIAVALELFAGLERELADRIGASPVAQLRRALDRDWGPPLAGPGD